jgi:hypothetical protein
LVYQANCADCGAVVIRADESSLHASGPQASWRCTFTCPVCQRDTLWVVPAGASHLLVAGGARVTTEPVPCAVCEPTPPADRALHLDDVIDFHELLAGDTWFDQLLESGHSSVGRSS